MNTQGKVFVNRTRNERKRETAVGLLTDEPRRTFKQWLHDHQKVSISALVLTIGLLITFICVNVFPEGTCSNPLWYGNIPNTVYQRHLDEKRIQPFLESTCEKVFSQMVSNVDEKRILEEKPKRNWEKSRERLIVSNLPERNTAFLESKPENGVDSYLTLLWKGLRKNGKIVVTWASNQDYSEFGKRVITGMGGIGKTQLALAYAYEALDHGVYDVIYWINCGTNGVHESLVERSSLA